MTRGRKLYVHLDLGVVGTHDTMDGQQHREALVGQPCDLSHIDMLELLRSVEILAAATLYIH